MSRIYVYRLAVTYPAESHDKHGFPVPGWQPPGWVPDLYDPEEGPAPFGWPKTHLYLSRSGADKRADLLRSYGAIVQVEVSKPIEWWEP